MLFYGFVINHMNLHLLDLTSISGRAYSIIYVCSKQGHYIRIHASGSGQPIHPWFYCNSIQVHPRGGGVSTPIIKPEGMLQHFWLESRVGAILFLSKKSLEAFNNSSYIFKFEIFYLDFFYLNVRRRGGG